MTPRIPGCCYRLQFNKNFNFRDATALVDYLDALGVTDVYASPFLVARPGSVHGYDVIDHARLNPEIGTDGDLDALATALKQRGMGLIMDVVPNHMCIASSDNHWWNDVLENGRSSPYAAFFDIDWHPPKTELHEKVLLPVLGEQYGRVLENQELSITYEAGAFYAHYWESRYPIGPRTILPLLEPMVDDLRRSHPADHPDVLEMESIVTATKHLPTRWDTEPDQVRERMREKEIVKRRLDALVSGSAAVRDALERSLAAINGEKGNPRSFDRLEGLLADQAYRLSFWGVAAEEINYRRFFDINDLAAIRVELPNVLDAVHDKAFHLLGAGTVTGLRVDHVDGLMDPSGYLERLQRACAAASSDTAAPSAEPARADPLQTYVVVEKILSGDEVLPIEWPVHGTTGYEFLNMVNGLFVDAGGARAIERLYQRLREGRGEFEDLFYFSKRLILRTAMSSELYVLARRLDRISEQHRWSRDFTQNSLHQALAEVIACFPVYRTYTRATSTDVSPGDRVHILRAIRDAKRRNRATSESVFDFIADLLLLRDPDGLSDADRADRREFVLRLQQLTGPVMAKGLEDTVFYRYYPLASLGEVGGRPTGGGVEPARLHAWNARRLADWPHGLSTTATHDTKRGEDVRARLDVLSEIPREWQRVLRHWQRLNRRLKSIVDDVRIPSTNEEYLIYQTLIGAWPIDAIEAEPTDAVREALRARLHEYITKALREAKLHTSWINVNAPYERGVAQFIDLLLQPSTATSFVTELRRFVAGILVPGICNSLAQVVLKITAPGVPDVYQGTELWDLSLVDPDNRRPVDFAARRALLAELTGHGEVNLPELAAQLLSRPADGRIKLLVISRALQHRRRRRDLFDRGGYMPLTVEGTRARNIFAFARTLEGTASLTVVGRLLASVAPPGVAPVGEASWSDTRLVLPATLPQRAYRDALTGNIVELDRGPSGPGLRLSQALGHLPVAILEPS